VPCRKRAIRPIGETAEIPVDVRVFAATNQPIAALQSGRLRPDLYYRLSVITIEVPPLRERIGDLPLLAQHFIEHYSARYLKDIEGIDGDALDFDGPHMARKCSGAGKPDRGLFALRRLKKTITPDDLPPSFKRPPSRVPLGIGAEVHSLAEAEREAIIRALKAANGNKSKAAEVLGISRDRLYRKIELYGIHDA
jgi:two-component system response regulator HydG